MIAGFLRQASLGRELSLELVDDSANPHPASSLRELADLPTRWGGEPHSLFPVLGLT
jgi:hypothetical protein